MLGFCVLEGNSFQGCTFPVPKIMKIKAGKMYAIPPIVKITFHSSIVFCKKNQIV